MSKAKPDQLHEMMRERRFIRFSRRFEQSSIRGYVLDVGPKFFLLALVSDRVWFDGFECFRIKDVHDLKPDPYAKFAEAALKKRRERIPRKPRISLATIQDLLSTASKAFSLVTIHREKIDPHVCHIGRVESFTRSHVALLEIGPDAKWDNQLCLYKLSEITRVNFGGDYENALHLVGKSPPGR